MKEDLERLDESTLRDEANMAAFYAEFAEEDRALAEAGMADYAAGLDVYDKGAVVR